MLIFQKSILKSIKQDESIVALRWAEYQKYLDKIDFIKEVKEEKYQDGFLKDIFENCLGYTLDSTNPNDFNLEREKKNETDSKKADGVIYVDGKVIGVIELKAQNTKNLDKVQQQAFWYLTQHSDAKYVIISNFDELRFYFDKSTAYEKFSLFNLDYEEFKKLHLILSYESIENSIPLTLKDKSASFEKDISNKLYKDFSLFRTHLFENLVKNNTLNKTLLLRLTQKLCDRIIFILFAEDRGLLTANTIKEIRERHQNDGFGDRSMYDYYRLYFDAINKGNEKLNIPKYNGGLFAVDEILDSLIIDDNILDMKAQALSNYDFMSDVSVNILGHIFEQSLTDLEEINASINNTEFDNKKSKRKKDGVFYTPEYITKYIVDNTLGKLCNDKKEELKLIEITAPKNSKKPTKKEQIQKDIDIYMTNFIDSINEISNQSLYDERETEVSGTAVKVTAELIANDAGSMKLNIDGVDFSIDYDADTTLKDLKNLINDVAGEKVDATIVQINSGEFRLFISSSDTGTTQNITTTDGSSAELKDTRLTTQMTAIQSGLDAQFTFNGQAITRTTNNIDDLITGLDIELKEVGVSVVSVSQNRETILGKFDSFVEKYNAAMTELDKMTKSSIDSSSRGIFSSESTIKSMKRDMQNMVSSIGGGVGTMYDYGFDIDKDGKMTLDKDVLEDKLDENPANVQVFFAGGDFDNGDLTTTTIDGTFSEMSTIIEGYTKYNATLDLFKNSITDRISSLEDRKDTATQRLDARYEIMKKQFSAYDLMISRFNAAANNG